MRNTIPRRLAPPADGDDLIADLEARMIRALDEGALLHGLSEAEAATRRRAGVAQARAVSAGLRAEHHARKGTA
ncbi:MAG TPA: hypothetical protein VNJ02_08060 [Vicinamibacterales bacterium]|nr:hypothetical protein [Vicinamibacterales bacterium]